MDFERENDDILHIMYMQLAQVTSESSDDFMDDNAIVCIQTR